MTVKKSMSQRKQYTLTQEERVTSRWMTEQNTPEEIPPQENDKYWERGRQTKVHESTKPRKKYDQQTTKTV